MTKVFDATLKQLVDRFGADWTEFLCRYLGLPEGTRAEPLDADLSIALSQADKLFQLSEPAIGLLHLELESSWAGEIGRRLLLYSVLAEHRYGGPVYSVVVLLRPEANAPAADGELVRSGIKGEYHRFRYTVIRLWELAGDELLNGPVGLVPLALLTNDAQPDLKSRITQADQRVTNELGISPEADLVRTACLFLLGLRYDKDVLRQLFAGVTRMRDSSAYEMILDEGRLEGRRQGKREVLTKLGGRHFGPPTEETLSLLNEIADLDRLDYLLDSIDQAKSWDEWLHS